MSSYNLQEIKDTLDAAERIKDAVMLHVIVDPWGNRNKWVACRIDNGKSDGALYDTWAQAHKHQKGDPEAYVYIRIQPNGISAKEALSLLKTTRKIYKMPGVRLTDPGN